MTPFDKSYDFLSVYHCKQKALFSMPILYDFQEIWRWRISWPWNL